MATDKAVATPANRESARRATCSSAECLEAEAEAAAKAGVADVAAAKRGRAYRLDPTEPRLRAWLDALHQSGQHRRLAAAQTVGAKAFADLTRSYQPTPGADRPTRPGPTSPALRDALEAERSGDVATAIAKLGSVDDVSAGARLADLLAGVGQTRAAAELRSQARIELDERGAALRIAPFRRWYMSGLAWLDGHAVRLGSWRPMNHAERVEVDEIRHLSADGVDATQTFVLPRGAGTLVHDGRVYAIDGEGLEIRSLRTGRPLGRLELDMEGVTGFDVIDDGRRPYLALMHKGRIDLFELPEQLATKPVKRLRSHVFAGSTPTITRAYTGEGTHHHNFLNDVPSWVVSTAVSSDGKWLAVGTSDSVVHLYAAGQREGRRLEYAWDYEERRHMGGNPDLNPALDLAFDGGELVAAYEHGDLIRWNVHEAKVARHLPSPCPSSAKSYECGGVTLAALSPSGHRVATVGAEGLRVRDTKTGKDIGVGTSERFNPQYLTWTPDEAVLLGDIYANLWRWHENEGVRPFGAEHPFNEGGPRRVELSSDGRYLSWGESYTPQVVWDLHARRRLAVEVPADITLRDRSKTGHRLIVADQDGHDAVLSADGTRLFPKKEAPVFGKLRFVDEAGRYAVVVGPGDKPAETFVDLDTGLTRALAPGPMVPGTHASYFASKHGGVLARFGENGIHVHDTATGKLVHAIPSTAGSYRGSGGVGFALSPNGDWLAWLEQNEQTDKHRLPECTVHLVGLAKNIRDTSAQVTGWNNQLVSSPDGRELLVATENRVARLDVASGKLTPEPLEYVGANTIHYSRDGKLVIFEAYDRVELRDNVPGLPVLATIYALDDDGWLVQTATGAVDGSPSAPSFVATIVEGPEDATVFEGTLGWDRFAVPDLLTLAGGLRAPPPGVLAAP